MAKYNGYELKQRLHQAKLNSTKRTIVPYCICVTCGVRDDHSNEFGFCQNGHDDWLELKDVQEQNEFFLRAAIRFGLTDSQLVRKFSENYVLSIPVVKPRFKPTKEQQLLSKKKQRKISPKNKNNA